MVMPRVVTAETLDGLSEDDPAAMRSRRDLQRIHRVMGTCGIVGRALRAVTASRPGPARLRMLELGAGDGSLMLGVAKSLKREFPAVDLTLLDRQNLVTPAVVAGYASVGWSAASQVMDVFDWAAGKGVPPPARHAPAGWDVIVSNLFLHHFDAAPLALLLAAVASRTTRFVACEPRRAPLALAGSRLVGALGANAVTREDAVLSVHAGFRGHEIGALWPLTGARWITDEYSAGLFSHCFCAERARVPGAGAP
ncbi:MAG: hypothetical protein JWR68_3198 [Polaromonas sp.]|nr:hypothetical protein [Polaromonas sp.]